MKKIKPALLTDPTEEKVFRITMKLTGHETAQFDFSNRLIAREYFDFLRTIGVVAGAAIKDIQWEEL